MLGFSDIICNLSVMENSVPTSVFSVHKVTEFKSNLTLKPNSNKQFSSKLPLSWKYLKPTYNAVLEFETEMSLCKL